MVSVEDAYRLMRLHLGESPVFAHSIFVGSLLAAIAVELSEDAELWRITGFCHDLDVLAVGNQMHRHGPTAAEWLSGQLPPAALAAIAAHDHRAGLTATFPLALGLRLCDAVAVLDYDLGRESALLLDRLSAPALVAERLAHKPWLGNMIEDLRARLDLPAVALVSCLERQPQQKSADPKSATFFSV